MTVYGDLDVSVIDELPPSRTPIKTVVVGEDKRVGVYKGIERELKLGRQAYVVYPLIDESEKLDLKAATAMFEELRDRVFPHRSVGLLHGKMKADEKDAIMGALVAGEIDVLVSTVIEVGVDVPNASTMVIEHAGIWPFATASVRPGWPRCRAKASGPADRRQAAVERKARNNGRDERRLQDRGKGPRTTRRNELFETRQSGVQMFKINIVRPEILEAARGTPKSSGRQG